MSDKTFIAKVSLPYAEALLDLAKKSNILEKASEDITMINQVLSESDSLNVFLGNPLVTQESKKEVMTQLFSGQVSDIILTFLLVLIDRKRIAYIQYILERYLELAYDLESLVVAKVVSSVALTDVQQENLIKKLKSMTGDSQVKLEISVDENLIGGFTVQIGSKVIDASLRGQLKEIGYFLEAGVV